jgi:CRP/FNR family cyclic AMP-dependent transcriptional regulator
METGLLIPLVNARALSDVRFEHAFSDRFVSYMLSRNIRIEEDLMDRLFNSSEKRLARTLLLLARYGKEADVLPSVKTLIRGA